MCLVWVMLELMGRVMKGIEGLVVWILWVGVMWVVVCGIGVVGGFGGLLRVF